MSAYHFLGMLGFYVLIKTTTKNKLVSYTGFLLLLFSSLGTRMFDSYLQLIYVPIIWFFAFLVLFHQKQSRRNLLGIIFTIMLLLITYIPFYFIIIAISFIICYILFFPIKSVLFTKNIFKFLGKNKCFTLCCCILLLCAAVPGYSFFVSGKNQEIVMPARHASTEKITNQTNTLKVNEKNIKEWGVTEELLFSKELLTNIKNIHYKVCYIPIFGFIILFLIIITPIKKESLFLSLWLLLLYLIATPNMFLHNFMLEHIFFFKYFRNLHFFLWFIILPLYIFIITNQFNYLIKNIRENKQPYLWLYNVVAHITLGLILLLMFIPNIVTYLTLFISLALSTLIIRKPSLLDKKLTPLFITLIIIIEPIFVYHFLLDNSYKEVPEYVNTINNTSATYKRSSSITSLEIQKTKNIRTTRTSFYIGTSALYKFFQIVPTNYAQSLYFKNKFIVYNNVKRTGSDTVYLNELSASIENQTNEVYLTSYEEKPLDPVNNKTPQYITKDSGLIDIIKSTTNQLHLTTHINHDVFLVYTDNYSNKWTASINNTPTKVYQSNITSKGIFLPKGNNSVVFKYKNKIDYLITYTIFTSFLLVLLFLIKLSIIKKEDS
ncbi:MAG: hypothetical protein ACI9F2_000059 [Lysobacterales bacterium]|jgi:hypothetical protein